jgi:hypothetical protein
LVWANPPISGEVAAIERLPSEYLRLVARADGIVAFDGALRILGLRESQLPDILQWNEERGWRAAYGGLADDLLFFAENAFGDQYAFEGENIIAFDSETAKKVPVGCTLEEWEASILDNLEAELGISTLRRWRSAGNELAVTQHLCPKYPPAFVLGALGTVENLIALPRSESMRLKGVIARQVHNLPPGSKIGLTVEP